MRVRARAGPFDDDDDDDNYTGISDYETNERGMRFLLEGVMCLGICVSAKGLGRYSSLLY